MSFRQQTGNRGTSRQFSKVSSGKKNKTKKTNKNTIYLQEETPLVSPQETAQRFLSGIDRLGNQIFALSPFSYYFDDWLINLQRLVEEFESTPDIHVDEQFQSMRTQIFLDVTTALDQCRLAESTLSADAKALADNNYRIVEADREYVEKTRELSNCRNSEVTQLSNSVRQLEEKLVVQQNVKVRFYQFNEKKRVQEALISAEKELGDAKNKSAVILQNFVVEQTKLHDAYVKHKQQLSAESGRLHRMLEKFETDVSLSVRQTACNDLVRAVNEWMVRVLPVGQ